MLPVHAMRAAAGLQACALQSVLEKWLLMAATICETLLCKSARWLGSCTARVACIS
jgi:hypothetical protein